MPTTEKQPSNTRRDFLGLVASAATGSVLLGQNKGDGTSPGVHARLPEPKLIKEFRNAYLMAVSPDGAKVCLYFTNHPQMTFNIRGNQRTVDEGNPKDEALRVIEMGSWKDIYSTRLRAKPTSVSFFARSDAIYAETLVISDSQDRQRVVIDLPARNFAELVVPYRAQESSKHYCALSGPLLVGMESVREIGPRGIILATLPGYKEIARVPFAVTPGRIPANRNTDVFVSADRKILIYLTDHTIVCRRADDLGIVWTRQIERDMFGVRFFSMTPDGGIVAAAVMDTMFIADQKNYYVGVFEGRDGSPVARLHLNGFECLAISPDGKLLGVGQRIRLKSGEMQPTVNVYGVSSGQQVATIVHDRLRVGRGDFGNDEIRCEFTPDGRYLITSSIHVKIWDLHA